MWYRKDREQQTQEEDGEEMARRITRPLCIKSMTDKNTVKKHDFAYY